MNYYTNMVSRRILVFLYYAAKTLTIFSFTINWDTMKVVTISRLAKMVWLAFRMTMLLVYVTRLPEIIHEHLEIPQLYNRYIGPMQEISLAVFTLCIYLYQTLGESRTTMVVRRFFKLYEAIKNKIGNENIFCSKFVALLLLKLTATTFGLSHDISNDVRYVLEWNFGRILYALVNNFIWMGNIVSMDICFVGFLIMEAFFNQMGSHLECLANRLVSLEEQHSSRHAQMKVLCECSDELDDCGIIFSEMYRTANVFIESCHLSILYCIYYNFVYLLLQLNESFWDYRVSQIMPWEKCCACAPKVLNLLLLILSADGAVKKSSIPLLIGLDTTCSGMDCRWDESVESFLNRQNFEYLQIKVLGLFQLTNEFALLVLSGGITYLFLLIQFDMMWPEHKQPLV